MAILLGDGFSLQSEKFNFERDAFDTLEAMKNFPITSVPDGFCTYCKEDKKEYRIDKSGEISDITGFWKEKKSGVGADGKEDGAEVFNDYECNIASGYYSHAEGYVTSATGLCAHAEGFYTVSAGEATHAEGYQNEVNGDRAHVEGCRNLANGWACHVEGRDNATGDSAEGSHVEGRENFADAHRAHAEGFGTNALGQDSHTEGTGTTANNESEHASGRYNLSVKKTSSNTTADATHFSVGIGTSDSARKNAFEIKQNGDAYFEGLVGSLQKTIQNLNGTIDENRAQINEALGAVANKVDKVEGKGLSTNDYTTADKTQVGKIDSLELQVSNTYTTKSCVGGVIALDGKAYCHAMTINSDTTISINSSVDISNSVVYFQLIIDNQVVSEVVFPENLKWITEVDLTTTGRKVINFGKLPGGDWHANFDWEEVSDAE